MWPDVLITAASRRVTLVNAFRQALAAQRPGSDCRDHRGGRVVVTDVNPLSPAVHVAHRAFRVPYVHEPGYLDAILDIAVGEGIRLIVPTIDDELALFGAALDRFAAHGIRVAVSPAPTSVICGDKLAACTALRAGGVAAAETWLGGSLPEARPFPLFVKPRHGRGGVGAFPARDARELAFFLDYVAEPVVQEYLDGPEFTIDMLCDFGGRPLSIVPRRREVIRAGVIDRGCTVNDPALLDLGRACANVLAFAGAVNIQCRVVDGRPVVFEINPRFSGGIGLTIAAGADFPRMLLALAAGQPVPSAIGAFQDRLWMSSYEASILLPERTIGLDAYGAAAVARGVA